MMLWDGDVELAGLADAEDADELCRRLLRPSCGHRSRAHHAEAVDLLTTVRGTSELGDGFVALLLCTCPRWDRATGKLIAAIETGGLLSDDELQELAEAFLADEVVIVYPVGWVSPHWLEIDLCDPGGSSVVVIDEDTSAHDRRRIAPPLRRWAARRALAADPSRLDDLLTDVERLNPQDRGAVILGLLDGAAPLGTGNQRRLARLGLGTGMARVRRAALELVSELDGPDAALRRARSDPDASVRAWRPRSSEQSQSLSLL